MSAIVLTEVTKLMPKVGRSVVVNGQKIAVFQMSNGEIAALEDYCPLTNGPILEGTVSGHYVYEPMRDYKISLLDGQIQEPDEGQVKVYPVSIQDGVVIIEGIDL
ncbi:nitrite reductase (NAD(P)H) small subunit [Enterococcus canis]|jgi:Ferredoxin subunits of nitrite reductase and ring-hydroxylating dioxygenases|uniref:nitrite reductase (NAD(P)H) small subunit n=1 Tax=Enterococcus canis TaxID=214095 RepID=UPI00082EBA12|nr:nitrite reductase (NAD(P)H) small subunit [Enterococcus canis]